MTWPDNPAGWLTPEEWQAVRLSLEVALRSVVFGLPPAVLVAWLLARRDFRGRTLLRAAVTVPMVLPPDGRDRAFDALDVFELCVAQAAAKLAAWVEATSADVV